MRRGVVLSIVVASIVGVTLSSAIAGAQFDLRSYLCGLLVGHIIAMFPPMWKSSRRPHTEVPS